MRKSEMSYLPPELKQHITDVINSQFDFTQSDIIRLTAVRITELVKKQYGDFHYDAYNDHTMEYPDSYHIREFFKALGYKEITSDEPFGYFNEDISDFVKEERFDNIKFRGCIIKAEDWLKRISTPFTNVNQPTEN